MLRPCSAAEPIGGRGPGRRRTLRNRAHLSDAARAASLWQSRLDRNAADFEAAWKRARAGYWIGGHEEDQSAKDQAYELAMAAARAAIAARPNSPEGHFWLAANMGGYAEDHGIRGGLKYRGAIRESSGEGTRARLGISAGIGRPRAGPW